jgi:hypothetical protein
MNEALTDAPKAIEETVTDRKEPRSGFFNSRNGERFGCTRCGYGPYPVAAD